MIYGTCPTIKFIYRSSLQVYREQFLCREKGKSRGQRAESIGHRAKEKGQRWKKRGEKISGKEGEKGGKWKMKRAKFKFQIGFKRWSRKRLMEKAVCFRVSGSPGIPAIR
jgi:hypothetical protein